MEILRRLADTIARVFMVFGVIMAIALTFHISAEVIARYIFNSPIPGTTEIVSKYYMVGLVFLPLAYTQLTGQQIRADVIPVLFGERAAFRLHLWNDGIVCLVAGMFAWRSALSAWGLTLLGERAQTPYFALLTWPSRWILPLGFGALCLVAGLQMISRRPPPQATLEG
jgi:TRAP-type C4-dicarboxylate transport system permease small subunit